MTEVFIDLRTLSFVLVLITGLMAGVLTIVWRSQRAYPGVGFWVLSNLSASVGFLLIGIRGAAPDLVSIVIGNAFVIFTLVLAYIGIRRFFGLDLQSFPIVSILLLHIAGILTFTYIFPDLYSRIYVGSAASALLAGLTYLTVKKESGKTRSLPIRIVSWSYLLFAFLMVGRIVGTFGYSDLATLYTPDWIQSASFLSFILLTIVWTFNFVIMNNDRLNNDLIKARSELMTLATTDHLTGLKNARAFLQFAASEIKRSNRHGLPLTLVVFDVDHFKSINDTHGHAAGDKMLREISRLCKTITRQSDMIARMGGEEFALLLTHTDIEGGQAVAETFRKELEMMQVNHGDEMLRTTSSFGVAQLRSSDTLRTFLERADELLYTAKKLGRNRVVAEQGRVDLRLVSFG